MQHNQATGSALLDTYLQFITENTFGKFKLRFALRSEDLNRFLQILKQPWALTSFYYLPSLIFLFVLFIGMGMTQEQAAAALHAAKMAQLGAMGHNFDKLPAGLLPPQMDLAKLANHNNNNNYDVLGKNLNLESGLGGKRDSEGVVKDRLEIRRGNESDHEPMDLGLDQTINTSNSNNGQQTDSIGGASSSAEEGNYSDDEGHGNA